MKNKRNNLLLVLIIILVLAIIGLVYVLIKGGKIAPKAEGEIITLSLSPASKTVAPGEFFDVHIVLNTGDAGITWVDVNLLHYDKSILEVQDADLAVPDTQITPTDVLNLIGDNIVDTGNGTIRFRGYSDAIAGFVGNEAIAIIKFKALNVGSSSVYFDFNQGSLEGTTVTPFGGVPNALTSVQNASYNIQASIPPPTTPPSGGGKKTPTSSPSQTVTSEPTPEPTHEPTPEPLPPLPSSVARITATPTPQIPSPTPEPPRISKLDLPIVPEANISSSPVIKIGGFSITPKYIWFIYLGGPILVTLGIYFWWRSRKKRQKSESPPNNTNLKI